MYFQFLSDNPLYNQKLGYRFSTNIGTIEKLFRLLSKTNQFLTGNS